MGATWSVFEVELIVADYLDMLEVELAGERYSKTEHRRRLIGKLNQRTEGSIERKHQNISAVLREAGVPFVDGYKPLGNYQRNILPGVVHQQLASRPTLLAACERSVEQDAELPSVEDILEMLVVPPESPVRDRSDSLYELPIERPLRTYDYLQREAANASLGAAGEQLVLRFEKARLISAGKNSLAERVEQVSVTEGDHLGYDVRSFEVDGRDRMIEAKTTRYGKHTPFFVSRNEVRVSQDLSDRYWLYRVFRFAKGPGMFAVPGALDRTFHLSPHTYTSAGLR